MSIEPVCAPRFQLGAPGCYNCKVLTVRFLKNKASAYHDDRSHFECPSCFDICSEPISYVIEQGEGPLHRLNNGFVELIGRRYVGAEAIEPKLPA